MAEAAECRRVQSSTSATFDLFARNVLDRAQAIQLHNDGYFDVIIYYRTEILPRMWVGGRVNINGIAYCKIEFKNKLKRIKR
jgi:hypothetical protein